jgi:hypothetical protein
MSDLILDDPRGRDDEDSVGSEDVRQQAGHERLADPGR